MSQRAAWQLDRLGIVDVYDFVYGKSYWIGSGRPTVGTVNLDERVLAHVVTDVSTVGPEASTADALSALDAGGHGIVTVVNEHGIVLGTVRAAAIESADSGRPVGQVMRVGPTTVRPDESVAAVRERMAKRNVSSLLVSRPTGELIGVLLA